MEYTLSYAFLETFGIPPEFGANFEILGWTIFITGVDDAARLATYAAVELQTP